MPSALGNCDQGRELLDKALLAASNDLGLLSQCVMIDCN